MSLPLEPGAEWLATPSGRRIAVARRPGDALTVVWLCGLHSDMTGSKALAVEAWAGGRGLACLRFDYGGHGQSKGVFADFTLDDWLEDTLAVVDATEGPLLLAGSSMGGWMALLAARARPGRVAGLCLIAPAPDFTEDLMWEQFDPAARAALERDGVWTRPSAYQEEGYPITMALIESGRRHLLLRDAIAFAGPVRILHGQADPDVPWWRSLSLMERLTGSDVQATFVKDAGHRLSRAEDIALLLATLDGLAARLIP